MASDAASTTESRPALLASIHDVSPLTLGACQEAARLLNEAAGLTARDLTLLVIPFHEGSARLDRHPETVRWLRGLVDAGATVVWHGLTHRMPRAGFNPASWFWGYGFARGQGELYRSDCAEVERRLSEGREILNAAGLREATTCFVPPAWLLSSAARRAVDAAGFDWIELLDGIQSPTGTRAKRLIGWGSLNAVEATATTAFAFLQRHRAPADTRFCVHPADMRRPAVCRSIATTARALREQLEPLSYGSYL